MGLGQVCWGLLVGADHIEPFEVYMMAQNDSLAAKALPWHWDQRRHQSRRDGLVFLFGPGESRHAVVHHGKGLFGCWCWRSRFGSVSVFTSNPR